MSENISVQISGTPEAIARLFVELTRLEPKAEPWWKFETPWFERHGKLTPDEAADLEASTYSKRNRA
ncbi:hypothetical protein [Rhizobium sp. 11_C7_N12_5]|uniref:hypothetical protein n=1 Tax=Rhizobium sp. 11_C7_N12_5 TaxID=3240770 RepID=UPI003F1F2DEE